jgi:SAM-dependent methyltransferase
MPDSGFLTDLYAENYFNVWKYSPELIDQVGIADTDETDQRIRREKTQQEVRRWIRKGILPNNHDNRSRKLLEIGGGRGYLQLAAQEEGWNTIGLEISPHGIKEAISRGLTIIPIVLDELCDKYVPYTKFFDLVVFFDFLEHVTDPCRALRMVHSILKEDGTIILRVPCILEDDCPMYHLIDHIWHFSERTLEILLNRENFSIFDRQPSGRFPGEQGQVQNITFFARKTGVEGRRE